MWNQFFLENHSDNDSDDDVEIQVYSKSDSEGIVMAILEDTVEAVMERGVPWPCRHRMPDEILSEGFLPDPEGETQEIHQTYRVSQKKRPHVLNGYNSHNNGTRNKKNVSFENFR